MKIPPLIGMEPLPPVPTCEEDLIVDEMDIPQQTSKSTQSWGLRHRRNRSDDGKLREISSRITHTGSLRDTSAVVDSAAIGAVTRANKNNFPIFKTGTDPVLLTVAEPTVIVVRPTTTKKKKKNRKISADPPPTTTTTTNSPTTPTTNSTTTTTDTNLKRRGLEKRTKMMTKAKAAEFDPNNLEMSSIIGFRDVTKSGEEKEKKNGVGEEDETEEDEEEGEAIIFKVNGRKGTSQPSIPMPHGSELLPTTSDDDDLTSPDLSTGDGLNNGGTTSSNEPSRFYFLSKAEDLAKRIWAAGWMVVHHKHLPKWLMDNDFLVKGHRPPMNSFWKCFKSIFRVHTETGNIWTHLLAWIAFITIGIYFMSRPRTQVADVDKFIFAAFFFGAIVCLSFSWIFHTVYCHSENVGKFFNKLDYCGIALLTMGSFVPWLYYNFYCQTVTKYVYLAAIFFLGSTSIVVSMWDKFAQPRFRPIRAGVFIGLGLSGIVPAMHYSIMFGFWNAINNAALGWLILMAALYIGGALIYAVRIPERIWPGRFDIWFQSHQIFHICVVAALFVHYHGITLAAQHHLSQGVCPDDPDSFGGGVDAGGDGEGGDGGEVIDVGVY